MTTIEVTEQARARLHELVVARGEPDHVTVEKAIELLRRHTLLESANAAYEELQRDPDAWRDYQAGLAAWDVTVGDGMEGAECLSLRIGARFGLRKPRAVN